MSSNTMALKPMSLEQAIQDLTITMHANIVVTHQLIEIMMNKAGVPALDQTATVAQAFPAPVAAPVTMAAPAPVAVAAAMPAPPSFAPPVPPALPANFAPAAPVAAVPFSDLPGLLRYAGDAHGVLEKQAPGKGQRMNEVLASVGHQNINDVRPDQFGAVFAGIEALKAI